MGNQIFQYMFAECQRQKGNKVYGYYNPKWLQQHNGLEVDKVLDADMPPCNWYSNLLALLCRTVHRFDKLGRFFSTDEQYNASAIYYSGYWQDLKFYKDLPKPQYKHFDIGEDNAKIKDLMRHTNSVSMHIRRGDYLESNTSKLMGGICTLDYYNKAIALVKTKIQTPVFFVFSDDIEWAKENFAKDNMHFIDWNTGKDSFFDMYLMSQCKAHIIANSSFSYWGAYLSDVNLMTIYPSRWYNGKPSPAIAPAEWIGI